MLPALIALLASAAPASGAPATTAGSVVVRWHSNPETCAEHGLCGRSGVLSWRPEGDSAFIDLDADVSFLSIFDSQALARSYRGSETCVDRVSSPADIVAEPGPHKGTVVLSMRNVAEFSFGRCAGPLGTDFAPALPRSRPLTRRSLRRGALIDLRARTPFSTGPFAGEVISTLTLRAQRESGADQGESTRTVAPRQRRPRLIRYGTVTASYAIEGLSGDAGYELRGAAEPECRPFDTCGLDGQLMLHADVRQGTLRFTAVRPLAPGANETVPAGLRALRAGRARLFGDARLGPPFDPPGEEAPLLAIPLTETVTPAGGETCSDTGSFTEPYLDVDRRRSGVGIRLRHGGNADPDPLRTRCPGPGVGDVATLAGAVVPLASIAQPRIVVTLEPSPGFTSLGLRGAGRGGVQLSLRLTSLRATTRRVRVQREETL